MVTVELPSLLNSAVAVGAFYLLYCIYWELTVGASRRRMIRQKGCLPPTKLPDWDPFLGTQTFRRNIKNFKAHRMLEAGKERFDSMGTNTFQMRALTRDIVLTIEPENLKTIQALDFKKWDLGSRRKTSFAPFLGHGIFTTDGQAWQHSRDMLRPNFVRTQIGDLDTQEKHVSHLIQAIPRDGSTVDMQELFFRLTIDSATEFLFGESTNCLAPGTSTVSASKFAHAFNASQDAVANHTRFGFLKALWSDKVTEANFKFVHDFVDGFVDRGLAMRAELQANPPKRYVFLHALCAQTSDRLQIRSELLNILLAGRDTTASLLSNVWHTLSKRPDLFAKLREEVINAFPSPDMRPTFAELKELKYLRAVLNESLRLYPVVPANSREATEDTTLPMGGGPDGKAPMFVPKGGVVAWSVYSMQRRKDFYGEDADEFKPERWLGEKGLRPGWEYLPFNGGPRICLGQQFAITEASYTMIRLLQEFEGIESRDPEPWREWLTLTCTGFGGCHVALKPATPAL